MFEFVYMLGTGRSRLEQAGEMGLNFNVVRNIPIMDGIQAARSLFNRCWFDEQKCRLGFKKVPLS